MPSGWDIRDDVCQCCSGQHVIDVSTDSLWTNGWDCGVPSKTNDIRLGDIVVSQPSGSFGGGVVQYDYGKTVHGGEFEHTGTLDKPPQVLLTALSNVQSNEMLGKSRINEFLAEIPVKYPALSRFTYPHGETDLLYQAEYDHPDQSLSCDECKCDRDMVVQRATRPSRDPRVFYGLIASGNQVLKHGLTRDQLAAKHGMICFEMEAAGLMDHFPCLVIRGICDYADSHKTKQWQAYAAATAAAYAKEILSVISVAVTHSPSRPLVNLSKSNFQMTSIDAECLRGLFLVDPEEDKIGLKRRKGDRAPGTCEWILKTQEIHGWLGDDATSNILWLYGDPGTGKSTTAIALADWIPQRTCFPSNNLAYFFCDSGSEIRRTATAILRGLLYQLVQQQRPLLQFFRAKYEAQKDRLFSSFDAMWSILLAIANDQPTGPKYCIIDALDECDRESQELLLMQLKHTFASKDPTKSKPRLRILISSRPYPEIAGHLRLFKHTDLASYDEVQSDIRCLIDTKLSDLKKAQRYTDNISKQVSEILLKKAQGTFLWVGIACSELSNVRSRDAVKTLQKLPRGLDSLYQKLLDTALDRNKDDCDTITQILSFVAIARRPLSLAQLAGACQSYDDYDEADRLAFIREDIEMCRLMIIIQGDIVRLLHKSVKDFLLRDRESRLIHDLKAHAVLANRCIAHLLSNEAANTVIPDRADGANDTFIWYSIDFWPEHAHSAKTEFIIRDEHREFFALASDHRNTWLELYNHYSGTRPPLGSSLFHIAARWGIPLLIETAISLFQEQLSFGAAQSLHETPRLYNDSDFQPPFEGLTPLGEAARGGHIDVMSLLLDSGHTEMKLGTSVVEAAVTNGECGHDAIKLLLRRWGNDLEITEKALCIAAKNAGCGERIVSAILQHRADITLVTTRVLEEAAANIACGQEVARLLLAHGQIQRPVGLECVAFVIRCLNGKCVRLLLNRAGDEVAVSPDLLMEATRNPDAPQVVSLLLGHGGEQISIIEVVWESVIHGNHQRIETLRLLLAYKGGQLMLTERLAMAVASHHWVVRKELMVAIVKGRYTYTITERAVEVIARWFDAEVMESVLDRRSFHITSSKTIQMAAARNRNKERRESLMALLQGAQTSLIPTIKEIPMDSSQPTTDFRCTVTQTKVLGGHDDEVWESVFSHTGLRLATGSRNGRIIIYDSPDFANLDIIASGHESGVSSLAWNNSDVLLASGSSDGKVFIWDAITYSSIYALDNSRNPVRAIAWMNDDKSFKCLSLDYQNSLSNWSVKGDSLRHWSWPSQNQDFCMNQDGSQLILADTQKKLVFYNVKDDQFDSFLLDSIPISVVASRDFRSLLVNLASGEILLIDIDDRAIIRSFRGQHAGTFVVKSMFLGQDESRIVSGSEDSRIYIWDRDSGALVDILEGHESGCVNSISVNPANPDMFVSTGDDRTCRVWIRHEGTGPAGSSELV